MKSQLDKKISRRDALKWMGIGITALTFPGCASVFKRRNAPAQVLPRYSLAEFSPINRNLNSMDKAPPLFSGDQPDRTHQILWDKNTYLAANGGTYPAPTETAPLVIIGGGISGLLTAYLLREFQPVILERAERFGGNSQGESWQGIDYSIGAAYFTKPPTGTPLAELLTEIGADPLFRIKTTEDPVVYQGKRFDHFWEGETAPEHATQFQNLRDYFKKVSEETDGHVFPEIPFDTNAQRKAVFKLDQANFKAHLEKVAGGKLHPHIETALEHYCWSSFGASFSEISAAQGLNFYAGESDDVLIAPGGNAAVAEQALKKLLETLQPGQLRTRAIVVNVQPDKEGVSVSYEDEKGQLRSIRARAAVMACPKFVAAKILDGIEADRLQAIHKLKYTSYLVANVLLNSPIPDDFYDLFLLGKGATDAKDIRSSAMQQKVTDAILATYAKSHASKSVLTLYRAFPYGGARAEILSPVAYARYKTEFEEQLKSTILPVVGKSMADVVDIRLARWGHPMPVGAPGLIASGTLKRICKPFKDRVFFVNQDNWMLPAFETSAGEALVWAPVIRKYLLG